MFRIRHPPTSAEAYGCTARPFAAPSAFNCNPEELRSPTEGAQGLRCNDCANTRMAEKTRIVTREREIERGLTHGRCSFVHSK